MPLAAHLRTQIRAALAAALAGIAPNVFVSRSARVSPEQMPAILVVTPGEDVTEGEAYAPLQYRRVVSVDVVAMVKGEGLDDAADALGAQIEEAIVVAGLLGGVIERPLQLERTRVSIDDEASPPVAELTMSYLATARTLAANPGVPI